MIKPAVPVANPTSPTMPPKSPERTLTVGTQLGRPNLSRPCQFMAQSRSPAMSVRVQMWSSTPAAIRPSFPRASKVSDQTETVPARPAMRTPSYGVFLAPRTRF